MDVMTALVPIAIDVTGTTAIAPVAMVVKRSGSYYRITVEAPPGYIWKASGVHELVADGRGSGFGKARKDVQGRMTHGLERCKDAACDWCRP